MFELKGKIEFDPIDVSKKHKNQSSWKKIAMVRFDCDMFLYYSWFIERRFGLKLNQPLRGTHITIVSDIVDDDIYREARDMFNEKEITFLLDPTIVRSNEKGHWWLKVQSDDARNIRSTMGLTPDPYFGLHLTIGLANERNIDFSRYITGVCKKFDV